MTVPPLELETEEQEAAFEAARKRHELYHQRKKQREEAKKHSENKQ